MTSFSETPLTRHEWLQNSGTGIGGLAPALILKEEAAAAPSASEALLLSGQKFAQHVQNEIEREK